MILCDDFVPLPFSRSKDRTFVVMLLVLLSCVAMCRAEHEYAGPYTGEHLNRVAFPIGGIGAGMYCIEGTGAISHMSVRHQMEFFHEPDLFAAVCVKGKTAEQNVARVVEGPIPNWKYFGSAGTGNGATGSTYGLPRFRECEFSFRFPFCTVSLADKALPITATITGFSPFTPGDADSSSLPAGALEYAFKNNSKETVELVFSLNTRNFMGSGSVGSIDRGFVLNGSGGAFAFVVDGNRAVSVDHCWFRGGWWDALTVTWNNAQQGRVIDNPPVGGGEPGASLFVPLKLAPGKSETVRLLTCWYVPKSDVKYGNRQERGPAFRKSPSRGTAKVEVNQQTVSGFLGKGLVNTFDPSGDGSVGTLVSPEFKIDKKSLHLLVGGGTEAGRTCVDLVVGGKTVKSVTGQQTEQLQWVTWDLSQLNGKTATVRIVDNATAAWGHILADQIMLSDEPLKRLIVGGKIADNDQRIVVLADFEGDDYGDWKAIGQEAETAECCPGGTCKTIPETYTPWYATQFDSIEDVVRTFKRRYAELRERSRIFADTFYGSTLPPEVIEAAAANLTILKSPTVLRQHDGRLWCWEGCTDSSGCCAGSCTHVWNYAQAICHIFPSLERGLRQNEFFDSQSPDGRQAFRGNLPISPGGGAFDAADGQLGGIMKAHREWAISGDRQWLERFWPRIRKSMDYMIAKWDPRHTGLLEESHHNTYDINYYGPDGHCGSFYLGALAAMVRMGSALGDDVSEYEDLLERGSARMQKELYNGEYFIQIVRKEGLNQDFAPIDPKDQSDAYRAAATTVNQQGPKYQYGTGCLSDGVLGFWMAKVCGIDDDLVDESMVTSHLAAIHRYNLKHDLSQHANPQRPTFAMGDDGGLLLCTWPRGGKPLLPFVYSDEVWTGIEYQVASHLMMVGKVDEGLEVVRACRDRYDGVRRNPFNEYECGHWYARAMSSFALIQGYTGIRYDAVAKTLYVGSHTGDFRAPFFACKGYGMVERKGDKITVDVRAGEDPVAKIAAGK
jgi:uncharacterized protein (DUF608 family)